MSHGHASHGGENSTSHQGPSSGSGGAVPSVGHGDRQGSPHAVGHRLDKSPWVFETNPIATLQPDGPTCLEEAQHLIYGDRQQQYGSARKNFGDIAALWSVVLGIPVSDRQVAICLLQLKVARAMRDLEVGNEVKPDTMADMAGYVGCIEKIERGL